MTIFLYLMVGLAAGVSSGLLGVGGGIIMIPLFRYLFRFNQHEAQGTSLAVLLLPIGLLGVWKYYQEGYVRIVTAGWVAAGFVVGAFGGAVLASHIPDLPLKKIFGAVLLIVALDMIFGRR